RRRPPSRKASPSWVRRESGSPSLPPGLIERGDAPLARFLDGPRRGLARETIGEAVEMGVPTPAYAAGGLRHIAVGQRQIAAIGGRGEFEQHAGVDAVQLPS